MGRSLTMRLPVKRIFSSPVTSIRCFSQTTARRVTRPKANTSSILYGIYGRNDTERPAPTQEGASAASKLTKNLIFSTFDSSFKGQRPGNMGALQGAPTAVNEDSFDPYHLLIYAHKHNTHVTFTKPDSSPIVSMSCGNIGFTKSRRRGFDPAYSLTKYVFERLIYKGYSAPYKVNRVEVSFCGFGQGREAAVKALMSPEAGFLREKIVRVTDATPVKFAGSRSPKVKRI